MAGFVRRQQLEKLRRHIDNLENQTVAAAQSTQTRALGPVRFAMGSLHEIRAPDYRDAPAAQGFAAALASRIAAETARPVAWVGLRHEAAHSGHAYGCGLNAFGLRPRDLIFVYARTMQEALWAAEEAARSPRIGAVLVELLKPHQLADLTATRRLQLAAESSGATPILLRCGGEEVSAARSRWRVTAAQSATDKYDLKASGNPCWRVEVERCREGGRGAWVLEWDYERLELCEAAARRGGYPAALANGPPETAFAVA